MSTALKELGVDQLSMAERISLFHDLWDNISHEAENAPFSSAQIQEIDRRLAHHAEHPEAAIPWEQIEAEALARLRV